MKMYLRRLVASLATVFAASSALASHPTLDSATFVDICAINADNENGLAEPGETLEITVTIRAGESLTGVGGVISSSNAGISLGVDTSAYPDIPTGTTADNTTLFTALLDETIECCSKIDFILTLTSNERRPSVFDFGFSIGEQCPFSRDPPILYGMTTSTLGVSKDKTISGLELKIDIEHSRIGDLKLVLESPAGTMATLFDRPGYPLSRLGCEDRDVVATFSDANTYLLEDHCAGTQPWFEGDAQPIDPFSAFDGESTLGTWKLHATDGASAHDGRFHSWSIGLASGPLEECNSCRNKEDLALDYSSVFGTWTLANFMTWDPVDGRNPDVLAVGDLDGSGIDDIVWSFPGEGVWASYDGAPAVLLHPFEASLLTFAHMDVTPPLADVIEKEDLIVDFGAPFGSYILMNNATWVPLTPSPASIMASGDLDGNGIDEVIGYFGALGTFVYLNNTTWIRISFDVMRDLHVADMDDNGMGDLVLITAASGVQVMYNNSYSLTTINGINAERASSGDLDGNAKDDLVIDFGPSFGIWTAYNNASWKQLHPLSGEGLGAFDLDANHHDELIVDFGPIFGLWGLMNNSTWVQIHRLSPEGFDGGDLD